MVGWGLDSIRGSAELQRGSSELLDALVMKCAQSGKFDLTVLPEMHPGILGLNLHMTYGPYPSNSQ